MLKWVEIKNENNDYLIRYVKSKKSYPKPLDAAVHTVQHITENYKPPYILMLSGGVDSQAMLYSWHVSGYNYTASSFVYNNGMNNHDLGTLKQFAAKNGIYVNFIDFDLLSFLKNEHVNYAKKYRCGSPHITTFLKLSEYFNEGTVIFSGNYINQNTLHASPIDQNNFTLYRYARITQKSMVPYFFLETEDLAYSFQFKPLKRQSEVPRVFLDGNFLEGYNYKVKIYQDNGFPVIGQDKKFTGFELVKDYYDQHYSHLIKVSDRLQRTSYQPSQRTFDLLLRNKYEALYHQDKYITIRQENVRET